MAGLIPQDFIDDLIARADIVEVIGRRVQLKKAGREFKACCPFHDEKTPSFTVSPTKGFYHVEQQRDRDSPSSCCRLPSFARWLRLVRL